MSSLVPRIAYFGLPLGALALLHRGYAPAIIVLGHTDLPGLRRLARSAHEIPILRRPDLTERAPVERILASAPDVILSWFYPKPIPERLLSSASRGAFGTHPSLLPRWRGPDPYFWTIYTGDAETGVTLHRLEREYDTGAIVAQSVLSVRPKENAWQLAKRLDRPALELLVDCARRLTSGENLAGVSQDEGSATLAPQPSEELLSIRWSESAARIVRLVRAAAPYPGASTSLGDEPVAIVEAETYEGELPAALAPAEALWTEAGLVIASAAGGVLVRRVRREDGELVSGPLLRGLFPSGLATLPSAEESRYK